MRTDSLQTLVSQRPRFLSFVRARVHDPATAEDILQAAYARAIEKGGTVEPQRSVAWFYRLLRNAVIDQYRRSAADSRGTERLQREPEPVEGMAPRRNPCRCVSRALAALKPTYREILEAVEVGGTPAVRFAATHGISGGNAAVRLHRARRLLAEALEGICGTCTLDGCSDCDCSSASPPPAGL
ncbi:MAG: RNA polymerase sigma factor [Acidobacteriota bacterium]